nr:helix-turn-helix domain-containing protein [Desulfofustis sp. PB-SRB1]
MVSLSCSKAIMEELEKELVRVHELDNLPLYKLVQGLVWIAEGRPWPEIGKLLGVSVKTLENWLRRFMVEGLTWSRGQHERGRGRKSKLTPEQKRQVRDWVEKGPQANGFSCG